VQAERFARQAAAALPTRKRLWRQIVRAKIRAQAALLKSLHGSTFGLEALVPLVKSGDPKNVEAQASRRYWPALFADKSFRRDVDANDQNRYLNYGYAVIRAVIARAICAAGLHPSLGLHHHNRYNAFCLADDLLEPLRPLADSAALKVLRTRGPDAPMDRETKEILLGFLTRRYELEGESRTLFDLAARTAASLAAVFNGEGKKLLIPEISFGTKEN
jgi:CRISPR-associated protein Cas1